MGKYIPIMIGVAIVILIVGVYFATGFEFFGDLDQFDAVQTEGIKYELNLEEGLNFREP